MISTSETPRTAVVTGAGSGIGEATARALAADGYRVVCAARRTERIEAVAAEIGGVAVPCDVTSAASVAALAEAEGHHPDLHLEGYRKVAIEISTHAIGGLSENDFILAAKINELPIQAKG